MRSAAIDLEGSRHDRVRRARTAHDHRELVAAKPRDLPVGRIEQGLQAWADELEQLVAGVVPEPIVDFLEAVKVHEQQRKPLASGCRLGDARGEPLRKP